MFLHCCLIEEVYIYIPAAVARSNSHDVMISSLSLSSRKCFDSVPILQFQFPDSVPVLIWAVLNVHLCWCLSPEWAASRAHQGSTQLGSPNLPELRQTMGVAALIWRCFLVASQVRWGATAVENRRADNGWIWLAYQEYCLYPKRLSPRQKSLSARAPTNGPVPQDHRSPITCRGLHFGSCPPKSSCKSWSLALGRTNVDSCCVRQLLHQFGPRLWQVRARLELLQGPLRNHEVQDMPFLAKVSYTLYSNGNSNSNSNSISNSNSSSNNNNNSNSNNNNSDSDNNVTYVTNMYKYLNIYTINV